jgi:hypothetical protein
VRFAKPDANSYMSRILKGAAMEENARSTGQEARWAYIVLALMLFYAIVRSIVAASAKTF